MVGSLGRLRASAPRQRWLWLLAALLLLADLGLFTAHRAQVALLHVQAAQADLLAAKGSTPDLANVNAACAELDQAHDEVGWAVPALNLAGLLPNARAAALAQLPALMDAQQPGCQALATAQRLLGSLGSGNTDAASALLVALQDHRANVALLGAQLSWTLDALDRVDLDALAGDPRTAQLTPYLGQVRHHEADLRILASIAPRAPDLASHLLGGDRPRTYLLMGQNADEARATGGFMGTLGQLTLDQGSITTADVRSSYLWDNPNVPKPVPPPPLQQYMNFGGWYLRDANWWIDFRRSSAQLLQLWDREQGHADQVDGVIAIDQSTLEALLTAVGGVDVPELGGHVTATSALDTLDAVRRGTDSQFSFDDYQRRKSEALGLLNRALMQKVTHARGGQLLNVLLALGQSARTGHVLLWFRDPDLEGLAGQFGVDGRVDPGTGDYLGVVNTSLSYGKVMPYIQQQVSYARQPNGTAVLSVTYSNTFTSPPPGTPWDPIVDGTWWDWHAGVFRQVQGAWLGYVRVMAPAGAQLVDASGWDDTPTTGIEGAVAVFGAPVLVLPGQTRTVSLRYRDPAPASAPLRVYHQPGAEQPAR